ncbi:MAG TPA: hypothetical protein DEB24_01575, partial [Coriobacteriia bacterium]|nr:hypothetical protein [Coriobacteriia bacterium]
CKVRISRLSNTGKISLWRVVEPVKQLVIHEMSKKQQIIACYGKVLRADYTEDKGRRLILPMRDPG